MRRQRVDTVESRDYTPGQPISNAYLATIFHSFVQFPHCQAGCYFPQDKAVKYAEKKWIGLTHPPIFYMFDKIKVEDHLNYVPKQTTEDRWKEYCIVIGGDHPSFQEVFTTLKKRKFIVEMENVEDKKIIWESFCASADAYIAKYPALAKKFAPGKRADQHSNMFDHFSEVHSDESLDKAWVFTTIFGEELKKYTD